METCIVRRGNIKQQTLRDGGGPFLRGVRQQEWVTEHVTGIADKVGDSSILPFGYLTIQRYLT